MKRHRLAIALAAALLAGCATATPYQAATDGYGYAEQKLEANRYRLSFTASSATPRETVRNYLMYRAAELTLANGYDRFLLAEQGVAEEAGRGARTGVSFGLGSFGGSTGFGLGVGTGLGGGEDLRAQAEVLMYAADAAEVPAAAYDAREVKSNLQAAVGS